MHTPNNHVPGHAAASAPQYDTATPNLLERERGGRGGEGEREGGRKSESVNWNNLFRPTMRECNTQPLVNISTFKHALTAMSQHAPRHAPASALRTARRARRGLSATCVCSAHSASCTGHTAPVHCPDHVCPAPATLVSFLSSPRASAFGMMRSDPMFIIQGVKK